MVIDFLVFCAEFLALMFLIGFLLDMLYVVFIQTPRKNRQQRRIEEEMTNFLSQKVKKGELKIGLVAEEDLEKNK